MKSTRAKILYVEDDRIDQMAFEQYIKNHKVSYDYRVVGSVRDAKNILKIESFDIVLLDYNLGDGNAFDIFPDVINNAPIIFLTSANDLNIAVKAMKSGAFDYLVKDLNLNYLELLPLTLEKAINHRESQELLKQKNEIIHRQKELLEHKNTLLLDSIDYAKDIQEAILPHENLLLKYFTKSFIFYKPKDIVSGDFYWMFEEKSSDCFYVAAADCTGHGVPGAFMSLLGFIMLDNSVRKIDITPAEILKEVNTQLMSALHQDKDGRSGKFGMDIVLIRFDKTKREITYSGAHNSLVVISNQQLQEIKADRFAIGTHSNCLFTDHSLQVKDGDMVYMYSDGYQDQMGGEKRKKFLSIQLKELLLQIHTLDPELQKEELVKKHLEWKNAHEQTDDILIIGLKI